MLKNFLFFLVFAVVLFGAKYVDFLGISSFVNSLRSEYGHDRSFGEFLILGAIFCAIGFYQFGWGTKDKD